MNLRDWSFILTLLLSNIPALIAVIVLIFIAVTFFQTFILGALTTIAIILVGLGIVFFTFKRISQGKFNPPQAILTVMAYFLLIAFSFYLSQNGGFLQSVVPYGSSLQSIAPAPQTQVSLGGSFDFIKPYLGLVGALITSAVFMFALLNYFKETRSKRRK